MKKLFLSLLIVAIVAIAAYAVAIQDFALHNNLSVDVHHFYVSETSKNHWGDDILGADVLEPGKTLEIHFHGYGDDECKFDLKAVDATGKEYEEYAVDLCSIHTIEFDGK